MGDAREQLLTTIHEFGAESVRGVWLFDQSTHERLFAREDVVPTLADLDVEKLIDNERYGYITDDTYETLYGREFVYTVRGFETFTLFRTFLGEGTRRIGLVISLDKRDGGYDFDRFAETVRAAAADHPLDALEPER